MGAALICEGIFLSYGDAKTPMAAMIAGNLVNVVLDPFLIFFCGLGVQGAALASFLGWGISGALMWRQLARKGLDRPALWCRASDRRFWRPILVMGAPVALSMLVIPFSTLAFNVFLASAGPAFVGGWALSARVEMMLTLPIYGLACSLIPFCGFNLGRKDAGRIDEAVRFVLMVSYAIMVPVALYFHFNAAQVLSLLRPDAAVLDQAAFCLSWAVAGYLFLPFELVAGTVAQGVGRPRYSLGINLVRLLCLRLPLAFVFMHLWGGRGIYLGHPVSMALTGLVSIFVLRHILGLVGAQCSPGHPITAGPVPATPRRDL
jgi:putative MATE family efflux protein